MEEPYPVCVNEPTLSCDVTKLVKGGVSEDVSDEVTDGNPLIDVCDGSAPELEGVSDCLAVMLEELEKDDKLIVELETVLIAMVGGVPDLVAELLEVAVKAKLDVPVTDSAPVWAGELVLA